MSHTNSSRRTPVATATVGVLVLVLACLGLAACGGSSKSSATNASASATTSSTAVGATGTGATGPGVGGPRGAGAGRFKALRECLQKNGITLPKRTPGQRPGGGAGGFLGGGTGPQLPKGVSRAQYEAALKKCGGRGFTGAGRGRLQSPAFKQTLAKFASCMRENGVNVPAPNTSGKGPIFSTKGIDTASAKFKAAETKCSSVLRNSFRHARPGGAPGAAPGGPPPGEAPAG